MFSSTAFEAMYQYLGLELHSKFIGVITGQKVFLGMVVMIFGFMFFMTTLILFPLHPRSISGPQACAALPNT